MHAVTGAYRRVLPNGLVIASARAEHAAQLEALQRVVFPTLADEERFKTAHYLKHLDLFPAGQFVGLDRERVVAATATIRLRFDFTDRSHTFADIIQGGWLTSHQPDGEWLYGADIGVHPDYRGRGLAQALYAARQELVWTLGLEGQVTAGMMSGYGAVKRRGLLRRARGRPNQRSHPLHAAARGIRVQRTAQGLPPGSGLRQLQRAHRARRGQGGRGCGAARRRAEDEQRSLMCHRFS